MFKKALHCAKKLTNKIQQPQGLISRLGLMASRFLFRLTRFPAKTHLKTRAWFFQSISNIKPVLESSYRMAIIDYIKPTRFFLVRFNKLIARPVRKILYQLRDRINTWFCKSLGQLGTTIHQIEAFITNPLVGPTKLAWNKSSRFLQPVLKKARKKIQIARIKRQARRIDLQTRQQKRQLAKSAVYYQTQPRKELGSSLLIRLIILLATLNVLLIVIVVRLYMNEKPQTEAKAATLPVIQLALSPTKTPSPTTTIMPTAIPITPAPTVDHQASGGSIAYVLRKNGNQDIFCLTLGRQNPIRLTDHPSDDRNPSWSPDGRQLAFSSRRDGNWELYLLDIPTMEIARLTYDIIYETNPTWSPDGQWLAYEAYQNGNLDIFIKPVSGGNSVQITNHSALDYAPAWSPSGRHLAFISWRDGNPDLFIFSLDDARDEASINTSRSPDIEEDHPAWHPGGDYLAFSGREGSRQLVFVQPMRNNLPSAEPFVIGEGRHPTWSPNGDSVLYAYDEGASHYLLANPVGEWGIAPELFKSKHALESADWNPLGIPAAVMFSRSLNTPTNSYPFIEIVADPAQEGPPYRLVTMDGVQASGPYLSDRVDDSFTALRERLKYEVGWDFLASLDKMWEPLDATPPPGLDARSWNKAGRAFDITRELNTGFNPLIEVVREIVDCGPANSICTGTGTFWRVFIRTSQQDGSQGEPLRTRPWNFSARYSGNTQDYEAGGRLKDTIPTGFYVDLTQLAADYGWERVPAGRTWRTFFPATLFWLYENRQTLAWEEAMQEIYDEEALNQVFGDIW